MPRKPAKTADSSRSRRVPETAAGAPRTVVDVGILPQLLGYNLRRAQIALWRDFTRTVGEGEVRPGLFSLMMLVESNPGIAQVDLANQLDIDKATIVSLIDRLEGQRWVRRQRSTEDRRRQGIYPTESGRQGLRQLRKEMLEHEQRFTRLFTPSELRQLIAMLRRIHP